MIVKVGLDTSLAILDALYDEFREPGYAPAPLLEHLVHAGFLGRKTGRGFYRYDGPDHKRQADPEVLELIRAEAGKLGVEFQVHAVSDLSLVIELTIGGSAATASARSNL